MSALDDILGNKNKLAPKLSFGEGVGKINPNRDKQPETPAAGAAQGVSVTGSTDTTVEKPKEQLSDEEVYKLQHRGEEPKAETPEEKRRKKRNLLFSQIGDVGAAIANMYFATKGAPNMIDKENLASRATRVSYDALYDRKQKEFDKYQRGLERARMRDQQRAKWQNELAYRRGRDKAQDDWRKKDLQLKEAAGKRAEEKQKADAAAREAAAKETARHNKASEKAAKDRNAIAASKGGKTGGGSGRRGIEWNGSTYADEHEYRRAVLSKADELGLLSDHEKEDLITQKKEIPMDQIDYIAHRVETHQPGHSITGHGGNSMPGVSNSSGSKMPGVK